LNGAAVKQNLEAFNLGRLLAHKPDALHVEPREEWEPLTGLEDIINDRKRFLTGYQDFDYAERYEALVRDVQAAERKVSSGDMLTRAAARSYFKLLAYKDEYEVARLYTEGNFEKRIREQFTGDFRIKFHLAPPLISRKDKNTGLPRKMTFGPWTMSLFRQLARFRFLRGSRLDPFSYTADRKLERRLIAEYEQLVEQLLPRVNGGNIDTIEQLLDLPEKIRGFGYIKRRNADAAEQEKTALLAKLDARPEPVRFVDPKAA